MNNNCLIISIFFIIKIFGENPFDIIIDGNLYIVNQLQADNIISNGIFCNGKNTIIENLNFYGNSCLIGNDIFQTHIIINNLPKLDITDNYLMIDPESGLVYKAKKTSPDPIPETVDIQNVKTNQIISQNNYLNINTVLGETSIKSNNNISLNSNEIIFNNSIKSPLNKLFFNCHVIFNAPIVLEDLYTENINIDFNKSILSTNSIIIPNKITIKAREFYICDLGPRDISGTITCLGEALFIADGGIFIDIDKITNINNLSLFDNINYYLVSWDDQNRWQFVKNDNIKETNNIKQIYTKEFKLSSIGAYSPNTSIELHNNIENTCKNLIIDNCYAGNILYFNIIPLAKINNLIVFEINYDKILNIDLKTHTKDILIKKLFKKNNAKINFNVQNISLPSLITLDYILPNSYSLTLNKDNTIAIKEQIILDQNIFIKIINNNKLLQENYKKIINKNKKLKQIYKKINNIISLLEKANYEK